MVKELVGNIQSSAILSDNELYRYKLTRVWDINKPEATIIMLNPSKADMLKNDRTVMNLNNFLIDNEYGSMSVVNLFAYRATAQGHLKYKEDEYEEINDKYLEEAFDSANIIIVAWTRDNYVIRKRKVEKILQQYKNRVKCLADSSGKKPRHPRDLADNWTLENYEFEFI